MPEFVARGVWGDLAGGTAKSAVLISALGVVGNFFRTQKGEGVVTSFVALAGVDFGDFNFGEAVGIRSGVTFLIDIAGANFSLSLGPWVRFSSRIFWV